MQSEFDELMEKYLCEDLTAEEMDLLTELLTQPGHENPLQAFMGQAYGDIEPGTTSELRFSACLAGLQQKMMVKRPVFFKPRYLSRYAAVFILLFLAGWLVYFVIEKRETAPGVLTGTSPAKAAGISPGTGGGELILSNGNRIVLGKGETVLAREGGMVISGGYNQVRYQGHTGDVYYNKLVTPKGRTCRLLLADGTKVWLNAFSSLYYPVNFKAGERVVTLSGEAYFEVYHEATRPFKVNIASGTEVEVLGTHFNVNAYPDEASVKTTLLRGSVRLVKDGNSVLIAPGQQALCFANSHVPEVRTVEVDKETAWKNGYFQFANEDVQTVMRHLARWYDIDVVYEGEITRELFAGEMQQTFDLNQVLEILGKMGIHCRLDERTVTVLP